MKKIKYLQSFEEHLNEGRKSKIMKKYKGKITDVFIHQDVGFIIEHTGNNLKNIISNVQAMAESFSYNVSGEVGDDLAVEIVPAGGENNNVRIYFYVWDNDDYIITGDGRNRHLGLNINGRESWLDGLIKEMPEYDEDSVLDYIDGPESNAVELAELIFEDLETTLF